MKNFLECVRWLPTFCKELGNDTLHLFRHARWLHRDDKTRHWHCTLCNVDLTAIKQLPKGWQGDDL